MQIEIKKLKSLGAFKESVELQRLAWRYPDNDQSVPDHMIHAFADSGNIVLAAYAENRMVGLLVAFLAQSESKGIHHHSHILAVHPEFSNQDIGRKLKLAHFDLAKANGIKLVAWTFDPLMGRNANLNIRKLGARFATYYPNYYGTEEAEGSIWGKVPTDRVLAEWFIENDKSVKSDFEVYPSNIVNQVNLADNNLQAISDVNLEINEDLLFVEIPKNFQTIIDKNSDLAIEWRKKTEKIFVHCFNHGFVVNGFKRDDSGRNFYRMEKE